MQVINRIFLFKPPKNNTALLNSHKFHGNKNIIENNSISLKNRQTLMFKHWGWYAIFHDYKRIKSGHAQDTYGQYTAKEKQKIIRQCNETVSLENLSSFKSTFKKENPSCEHAYKINAVKGLFKRKEKKNKYPYRILLEKIFQNAYIHPLTDLYNQIKKIYSNVNLSKFIDSLVHGIKRSQKRINSVLSDMIITNYNVKIFKDKNQILSVYVKGVLVLLGLTNSKKPSFNLHKSIKKTDIFHLDTINKLYKKHDMTLVTNHDNTFIYFQALKRLISYCIFITIKEQLKHDFPKTDINLSFYLLSNNKQKSLLNLTNSNQASIKLQTRIHQLNILSTNILLKSKKIKKNLNNKPTNSNTFNTAINNYIRGFNEGFNRSQVKYNDTNQMEYHPEIIHQLTAKRVSSRYTSKLPLNKMVILYHQFNLLIPYNTKLYDEIEHKYESRNDMIYKMANNIPFKGPILGNTNWHYGGDLLFHFVNYDIHNHLTSYVKDAKYQLIHDINKFKS